MLYNCVVYFYNTKENLKKVLFIKIDDICLDKKLDFYPDACVKDENFIKEKFTFVKYKEKFFNSELDKDNFIKIFSENLRRYIKLFGENSMIDYFWSQKL